MKHIINDYFGVSLSFDVIKVDFGHPVRKYTSAEPGVKRLILIDLLILYRHPIFHLMTVVLYVVDIIVYTSLLGLVIDLETKICLDLHVHIIPHSLQ